MGGPRSKFLLVSRFKPTLQEAARRADVDRPLRVRSRGCENADTAESRRRPLALIFVRFWLTITPPIGPEAQAAAQAKGRERFDGFVETLGKRVQKGRWFADEVVGDQDPPSRRSVF